jgi:hypothetical protein
MYEVLLGAKFHSSKNKIFENESGLISKEAVVVSIKKKKEYFHISTYIVNKCGKYNFTARE